MLTLEPFKIRLSRASSSPRERQLQKQVASLEGEVKLAAAKVLALTRSFHVKQVEREQWEKETLALPFSHQLFCCFSSFFFFFFLLSFCLTLTCRKPWSLRREHSPKGRKSGLTALRPSGRAS